ncbi:hypothetical protein QQ008_22250 [Fulvivirgaceae bacterium BMA10]|uniref:Pyridoxamine 5'-phosphate oxidase putative domain-containing protein n=1 Tax=Splendidivirga corallicola TaxID=3051826 RepID=A0ABT8KTR1_9BACT|nr:hypothetical protein [Fulvivirgaceae bacterium BMA10]
MDIQRDWNKIRLHFKRSFRSNFHVSIASVDAENNPTVTPIGSLFLNHDQTGFYFEKYPSKLPVHAERNKNICVLAVNSNTWFWIKSLFKGKFNSFPAIKLYGKLGERRQASEIEITRLNRRMKATRGMKGHRYLWGDMQLVRDITFTKAHKINLGDMTSGL